MAAAFRNALVQVRRAGLAVRTVAITPMLVRLRQAQRTVMFYEGARFHEERTNCTETGWPTWRASFARASRDQ
jgi:hypothetical protein